jgi:oxygen-independent coproporphyrinogen-3 oxidase
VNALLAEIALRKSELNNPQISTIYFGGGTPSQLGIEELERIFTAIYSDFNISSDCEITLEANPDDLNDEYLKNLKQTPINRLSIGIQSSDDTILKLMRRRHTASEGISSVNLAFKHGYENISIDMIYGINGLSDSNWKTSLEKVLELPIHHLSAYHLGIEEGTLLFRKLKEGKINKIDENTSFSQYCTLVNVSQRKGFEQYEISNFAKQGKISKHNSSYWNRTEYLGFGPSAHSLIGNKRKINPADLGTYIKHCNAKELFYETEILSETDIINETIMLGLRTEKGISLSHFLNDFGSSEYNHLLIKTGHLNPDYYSTTNDYLKLTRSGMFVSDTIISRLFK